MVLLVLLLFFLSSCAATLVTVYQNEAPRDDEIAPLEPLKSQDVQMILFLRHNATFMTQTPRHQLYHHSGQETKDVLDYALCVNLGGRDEKFFLRCFTHAPDGYRMDTKTLQIQGNDLYYDLERYHGDMGPPGPMGLPCNDETLKKTLDSAFDELERFRVYLNVMAVLTFAVIVKRFL